MKRFSIILLAGLTVLAASCNESGNDPLGGGSPACRLRVDITGGATKAGTNTDSPGYETRVRDLQLLVYDQTGVLEAYQRGTSTTGYDFDLTTGEKTVWAIANCPDNLNRMPLDELSTLLSRLEDNSEDEGDGTFVMAGSDTGTVTPAVINIMNVKVFRLASRIALQSVRNSLTSSHDVILKYAFVQNVVREAVLTDPSSGSSEKGNVNGRTGGEDIDATSVFPEISVSGVSLGGTNVAHGEAFAPEVPALVYSYPDTSGEAFLTLVTEIQGSTYYYKVPLPELRPNTAYAVTLELIHLGTHSPGDDHEFSDVQGSISVEPWETGELFEATI